ncbi:MAG: hypothetical protein A3J79_06855 [Elusimicrobia bacterium RIFOXYB2_FULL_62_6]|nr:MAG: hypothetical protein A3J79_06855 [Elusimicrobia bacterium RIFOXYB2_FULL_62_6]
MPFLVMLFEKVKAMVMDMVDNAVIIYTDKGFEPFKKPVLFASVPLIIIYFLIYSPLGGKLKTRTMELEKLKIISAHAADFQDAKTRYAAYQRKLPLLKDKDEWLNFVMTSTSKSHGIVIDSLSSQTESEVGNFLLVSREATVTTTFPRLGKWIADMENSPILLKVAEMDLRKDPMTGGVVKVTLKLSTIFPRFGAQPQGQAAAPAAVQ